MSSLYIDRKGTELRLSGETLICYENEERIGTIPLAPIERIYLKGDVKLQASLLAKLGEKNIGIICLSGRKNTPTKTGISAIRSSVSKVGRFSCMARRAVNVHRGKHHRYAEPIRH